MLKKLFAATERTDGIIPKIEKVMRLISFLVLALDTLRFFKNGLEKLSNNEESEKTVAVAPADNSSVASAPAN